LASTSVTSDLVCQIGFATLDRRVPAARGARRPSRWRGPKGRLFRSRARIWSNARHCSTACAGAKLDALIMPKAPLDVLAQQIVAEVSSTEWDEDGLFEWTRPRVGRMPDSSARDFDAVVRMLADGFSTRRGVRAGYVHRDAVHKRLRGRKGGRMTAGDVRRHDSRHG
jgi:ATP-dependent Lhr-like helicase